LSIDSAKDFLELTKIKIASKLSGLFMIGGGVPKNFAQDTVVAGDYLGFDVGMHKYAVQITVADVRDGALQWFHAEGSKFMGQGRSGGRTNGLRGSDDRDAADRRLRLSQRQLEKPEGARVREVAGVCCDKHGAFRSN